DVGPEVVPVIPSAGAQGERQIVQCGPFDDRVRADTPPAAPQLLLAGAVVVPRPDPVVPFVDRARDQQLARGSTHSAATWAVSPPRIRSSRVRFFVLVARKSRRSGRMSASSNDSMVVFPAPLRSHTIESVGSPSTSVRSTIRSENRLSG